MKQGQRLFLFTALTRMYTIYYKPQSGGRWETIMKINDTQLSLVKDRIRVLKEFGTPLYKDKLAHIEAEDLKTPEDFANAPRDTRLRSIMLDLAQSPEQLRCSGMLYFLEDLDHYGESVYRNTFRV